MYWQLLKINLIFYLGFVRTQFNHFNRLVKFHTSIIGYCNSFI